MIYVAGRGDQARRYNGLHAKSLEAFERFTDPGWISLIRYDADALTNAEAMHQLGYYNLPPALVPRALVLGTSHLYLSARGDNCPYIKAPFENQNTILVFDRLQELPGEGELGQDRTHVYSLPIHFSAAPVSMAIAGDLLFAAVPGEGVAVLSLADPSRPTLIRTLTHGYANGQRVALNPQTVFISDGRLVVGCPRMVSTQGECWPHPQAGSLYLFDIDAPTVPQVGYRSRMGLVAPVAGEARVVHSSGGMLNFGQFDLINDQVRPGEAYEPGGFHLPGRAMSLFAGRTVSGTAGGTMILKNPATLYIPVFDTGQRGNTTLLDATVLQLPECETAVCSTMLDEGIIAVASASTKRGSSHLALIDTLTLDLRSSRPSAGETGVALSQAIELRLTRALTDSQKTWVENKATLDLIHEDGTEAGSAVPFAVSYPDEDTVRLTPDGDLDHSAKYKVVMRGVPGSRRTEGLFDLDIPFETGAGSGSAPEILHLSKRVVSTTGGTLQAIVRHAGSLSFMVAGQVAPATWVEENAEGDGVYELTLPANTAGPATLEVTNDGGGMDRLVGAVLYAEPLYLKDLAPDSGSVHGGTPVTIRGRGFTSGDGEVTVSFGGVPAPQESIKVLNETTLQVTTPAFRLGAVDVTVTLANGRSETLDGAFTYLQPSQSRIEGGGRIYDLCLDPFGYYLTAAAGAQGVLIYVVDSSAWTNGEIASLDAEALRQTVDLNGDGKDDRIVSSLKLPGGYWALGATNYFERGVDRILVTAVKPGESGSSRLFVISYPDDALSDATVLYSLPLGTSLARGIDAENSAAVVAMGDGGLGFVDIHLQTKAYLVENLPLGDGQSALDVDPFGVAGNADAWYAVASGDFDLAKNRLVSGAQNTGGGFYIVRKNSDQGLAIASHLEIPCSTVKVWGSFAYLAAGDAGLVIVDLADPYNPKVVSRLTEAGSVWDVDVSGHTAYLALGGGGILTVDVTRPEAPLPLEGMATDAENPIEAIVAGAYSAMGGGTQAVQVTPDISLKVVGIDPSTGVFGPVQGGGHTLRVRFNKAVDQWDANLTHFDLLDAQGAPLPCEVGLNGNTAELTLKENHGLGTGDTVSVVVRAGVESVNLISGNDPVVLYRLPQEQRFTLVYAETSSLVLGLDSVVPRRLPLGKPSVVTVSGKGLPPSKEKVHLFVGGVEADVLSCEVTDAGLSTGIVTARVPALKVPGACDVTVTVHGDEGEAMAILKGGLSWTPPFGLILCHPNGAPPQGAPP